MKTRKTDFLRVGELAKRTGLTVRTLHHWDQIGLLRPSQRTGAGHRLYGPQEIDRLQRILSLRALGLGLKELRPFLGGRARSLEAVLRIHRDRVRDQVHRLRDLETRLDWILGRLAEGEIIPGEDLLETMEKMTMIEKHFSPEQLQALKARREALGEEAIREAEAEWPRLIAAVKQEMQKGTDPTSAEVQALAKRWKALIQAFSGGDSGIEASLGKMYQAEPEMAAQQGLDPALFSYIGAAMRAGTGEG